MVITYRSTGNLNVILVSLYYYYIKDNVSHTVSPHKFRQPNYPACWTQIAYSCQVLSDVGFRLGPILIGREFAPTCPFCPNGYNYVHIDSLLNVITSTLDKIRTNHYQCETVGGVLVNIVVSHEC